MSRFGYFTLDDESDMLVELDREGGRLFYTLRTPNHHSGNLIRNFARLCALPLSQNEDGLLVMKGEVPCYINADNQEVYILRFGGVVAAEIYPDGRILRKASVPSVAKTLMSQTKDYTLDMNHTLIRTYIPKEVKFRCDLHTHMNGNLKPEILIAMGIYHQVRYPLYLIRKLGLKCTPRQEEYLLHQQQTAAREAVQRGIGTAKRERWIRENTFINFADLILENLKDARGNIRKIADTLTVLKDGQAVFTNLEKVYQYRYVFTKGVECRPRIPLRNVEHLPDEKVKRALMRMLEDQKNPEYTRHTIFQDDLLWIARMYQRYGIEYAEISDTSLLKPDAAIDWLRQVHEAMPAITRETGVRLRFLAAFRRIPLMSLELTSEPLASFADNIRALAAVYEDPYVAGCDFVGEEINDIADLKPVFAAVVRIAAQDPTFVIRVHAGENDSLKDNIAHSISNVKAALLPGQPMPRMRIGHGLYTYGLKTARGQRLLAQLREDHIALEFQLSSNVRLNNVSSLSEHPLKQYLEAGIACVQGTDGAALYGTNPIDEQLALTNLLGLSESQQAQMKQAETVIRQQGIEAFHTKAEWLYRKTSEEQLSQYYRERMEMPLKDFLPKETKKLKYCPDALREQIVELPWDKEPVILAGGSFNSAGRRTRVSKAGTQSMRELVSHADPQKIFFVIGDRLTGYEELLVKMNKGRFLIYAFVPEYLPEGQIRRLQRSGVRIRISPEQTGMAIYKSFNYEIFERRPSMLVAWDGNSACTNLIQEARNGKGKAYILINRHARVLNEKARSLTGYVTVFEPGDALSPLLGEHLDLSGHKRD